MFSVTATAQQSKKCSCATLSLFNDTAVLVSLEEGEYTVSLTVNQQLTLTSSARRRMQFSLAWVMSEARVKAG